MPGASDRFPSLPIPAPDPCMKVLVIGGSGYIGSHTVEELSRRGHEVCVFARGVTPHRLPRHVTIIRGDRRTQADLHALRSHRFDAAIDINAYTREETQAVINTLDGYVSRFVHLSSLAVCQRTSGIPIQESDPLVTDPEAGYAYDKAECERALRWAHTKNRFPFVCLRPTAVIGPEDRLSRENYFLKRILAGDPVIIPDSGAPPIWAIYVRDLAAVMVNALTAAGAEGRTYNLSQPDLVSVNDHVENIARVAGTQAIVAHIPSRLLERLGFNLAHFPYFLPRESLIVVDIGAAKRELDYAPTPYARVLRDTTEWFLERGSETEPSLEDRFPPVMPRWRERELIERYRAATRELEDRLTDDWLDEAMPQL
jgi:nucleoside-diphosphate-sugar epimerase